jgi:hypothetical protein
MPLAPVEAKMWEKSPSKIRIKISEDEIDDKYTSPEKRIITEINREKLPSFVESLSQNPKYIKTFYQRRTGWDIKMQSRLIESFVINIPVPPIILYEINYNSYEVMDGQQRITAIRDFYTNKFSLTGLELCPELNQFNYEDLPFNIRAVLNRRSISSIVIMRESTSDPEEALFLKQKTFERLNNGGVNLSQQEVRNCLYYGKFDALLIELSRHPIFAAAWGIPIDDDSPELSKNTLYKKMEDAELVLRFFALRNVEHFRNGMQGFLDLYMMKSLDFKEQDIEVLKDIFVQTINLAHQIYEENLFKPFVPQSGTWEKKPYKAYYDATMVGFSRHLDEAEILIARKSRVIEETKKLFNKHESRLLTDEGRTKADIQERINIFDAILAQVIGA